MRRHDKELTERAEIDAILHEATACHLAMIAEGRPYVVPMNFGYDGTAFYFHSADAGLKIAALRANPQVCIQAECGLELVRKPDACNYGMRYKSVIATGRAEFLDAIDEKRRALDCIVKKYAVGDVPAFPDAAMKRLAVFRVDIETITAKVAPPPARV
jgi:nitroimidazol reductase NimA-like FMN-containing flavoprotein (pyridoxamine 5'-phosphate oxidase superfamily)